jgi:hypothetical protein
MWEDGMGWHDADGKDKAWITDISCVAVMRADWVRCIVVKRLQSYYHSECRLSFVR